VNHDLLHRDISSNNILIAESPSFIQRRNPWAALIDFDLVLHRNDPATSVPERTGTLSFMALQLLDPLLKSVHYVWYDIESVFWYLYLQCLKADLTLRDHYDRIRGVGKMQDAVEMKTRLQIQLPNYVKQISDDPAASWTLLQALERLLHLDNEASGTVFSYGSKQVRIKDKWHVEPPDPGTPFALDNETVADRINHMVNMVTEMIRTEGDQLQNWERLFPHLMGAT
jgi:serine/threonine protein kinase